MVNTESWQFICFVAVLTATITLIISACIYDTRKRKMKQQMEGILKREQQTDDITINQLGVLLEITDQYGCIDFIRINDITRITYDTDGTMTIYSHGITESLAVECSELSYDKLKYIVVKFHD